MGNISLYRVVIDRDPTFESLVTDEIADRIQIQLCRDNNSISNRNNNNNKENISIFPSTFQRKQCFSLCHYGFDIILNAFKHSAVCSVCIDFAIMNFKIPYRHSFCVWYAAATAAPSAYSRENRFARR